MLFAYTTLPALGKGSSAHSLGESISIIKTIIYIMAARGRFELPHEWFKAICLAAWLSGNMVELRRIELPVQKIFTNHKSHSYLTSFVYFVRSASLYKISISRDGSNVM